MEVRLKCNLHAQTPSSDALDFHVKLSINFWIVRSTGIEQDKIFYST